MEKFRLISILMTKYAKLCIIIDTEKELNIMILDDYIKVETTSVDFKEELEEKKQKVG